MPCHKTTGRFPHLPLGSKVIAIHKKVNVVGGIRRTSTITGNGGGDDKHGLYGIVDGK
jgi:hypothetical protein